MQRVLLCVSSAQLGVFVDLDESLKGEVHALCDVGKVLQLIFMVYETKRIASLILVLKVNRNDPCIAQM